MARLQCPVAHVVDKDLSCLSHGGIARVDVVGAVHPSVDPLRRCPLRHRAASHVLFNHVIGRIPKGDQVFSVFFQGLPNHSVVSLNLVRVDRKRPDVHFVLEEDPIDAGRLVEPHDPDGRTSMLEPLEDGHQADQALSHFDMVVAKILHHVMNRNADEEEMRRHGAGSVEIRPSGDELHNLVVKGRLPMERDDHAMEESRSDVAAHVISQVIGRIFPRVVVVWYKLFKLYGIIVMLIA